VLLDKDVSEESLVSIYRVQRSVGTSSLSTRHYHVEITPLTVLKMFIWKIMIGMEMAQGRFQVWLFKF